MSQWVPHGKRLMGTKLQEECLLVFQNISTTCIKWDKIIFRLTMRVYVITQIKFIAVSDLKQLLDEH